MYYDYVLFLFLKSCRHFLLLVWQTFALGPRDFNLRTPRRILVMVLFLPVFAILQLIHWIGLMLDEIFFSDYRRVEVKRPVFIVGVPRSGTTMLHRVLARDTQFTTFKTWECLFALSITQRKFWHLIARLDRLLGRPFTRLLAFLESAITQRINDIHPSGLNQFEEDYFVFTPIIAWFLLILPFPFSSRIWQMGLFDRQIAVHEQAEIMQWYKRCVQKHLYVHGSDKTFLSKNAAFACVVGGLNSTFPDARYFCCVRDPLHTLPSQLSSLEPGLRFFGVEALRHHYRDRFVFYFRQYYENLHQRLSVLPDSQRQFIEHARLKPDLFNTVVSACHQLDIACDAEQKSRLRTDARTSSDFRSRHHYDLDSFGLDASKIKQHIGPAYARFSAQKTGKGPVGNSHAKMKL